MSSADSFLAENRSGGSEVPRIVPAASSGRAPFPVPWTIVMKKPSPFTKKLVTRAFRSISDRLPSFSTVIGNSREARKARHASSTRSEGISSRLRRGRGGGNAKGQGGGGG